MVLWLSVLGGVGLAHAGYMFNGVWCFLVAVFLLVSWRKRTVVTLLLVVFFGLSLGLWCVCRMFLSKTGVCRWPLCWGYTGW